MSCTIGAHFHSQCSNTALLEKSMDAASQEWITNILDEEKLSVFISVERDLMLGEKQFHSNFLIY